MGSIAADNQIFRRSGEVLPHSTIKELKSLTDAEILVKGETSEEVYRKALDRFNQAYVSEAASVLFSNCEMSSLTRGFRVSSFSVRMMRMLLPLSSGSKTMALR